MIRRLVPVTLALAAIAGCSRAAQDGTAVADQTSSAVIALERAALDRWIKADPDGYLTLMAADVTYFDPTTEQRIDGQLALQERLAPMRNAKLPFSDVRYEMIDPKVQRHGDIAILTFNLVNYGKMGDRPENILTRWNSTEVYRRVDETWKLAHSHWSFVRPEIKQPAF